MITKQTRREYKRGVADRTFALKHPIASLFQRHSGGAAYKKGLSGQRLDKGKAK